MPCPPFLAGQFSPTLFGVFLRGTGPVSMLPALGTPQLARHSAAPAFVHKGLRVLRILPLALGAKGRREEAGLLSQA